MDSMREAKTWPTSLSVAREGQGLAEAGLRLRGELTEVVRELAKTALRLGRELAETTLRLGRELAEAAREVGHELVLAVRETVATYRDSAAAARHNAAVQAAALDRRDAARREDPAHREDAGVARGGGGGGEAVPPSEREAESRPRAVTLGILAAWAALALQGAVAALQGRAWWDRDHPSALLAIWLAYPLLVHASLCAVLLLLVAARCNWARWSLLLFSGSTVWALWGELAGTRLRAPGVGSLAWGIYGLLGLSLVLLFRGRRARAWFRWPPFDPTSTRRLRNLFTGLGIALATLAMHLTLSQPVSVFRYPEQFDAQRLVMLGVAILTAAAIAHHALRAQAQAATSEWSEALRYRLLYLLINCLLIAGVFLAVALGGVQFLQQIAPAGGG